ncbi:MAG TPA: hypothetical protein VIN57_01665 [Magnetovibrio sp.]
MLAQDTIADAIFSEVEKRIIREHYGKPATAPQAEDTSAPKWAVKNGDDETDDADEEDEDKGDRDKGEKNKSKDKGKDKDKGKNGKDKGKDKSKGLPPGLAKRDTLPPGLARQLKEKGRLPAGIAKRDLPEDLLTQLPPRPESQEVTVVEGDVVLVDKATGIILDVIKDVVNGAGLPEPTVNPNGTLSAPPAQDEGVQENMLDVILKGVFGGRSQ